MTFYAVISAILFLGAFRELLTAVDSGDLTHLWLAATVALLVFNDAIYTSWVVEQQHREYKPPLMLLDLVNFGILSAVLISMNSTHENVFQVALPRIGSWLPASRAWLLLGVYWFLIILWTKASGVYDAPRYPKWLIPFSVFLGLAFFAQAGIVTWTGGSVVGSVVVTLYTAFYILVLRVYALRKGIGPPDCSV